MVVGAIDVGFSGAISIWKDGNYRGVMKMPTLEVGKKTELDEAGLKEVFSKLDFAVMEKAGIMPAERPDPRNPGKTIKQGAVSSGRFFGSYMFLRGLLVGMNKGYLLVPPQTWKAAVMKGLPKEKQASVLLVNQLIPGLKIGQNHNKADAILIGYWYHRFGGGNKR